MRAMTDWAKPGLTKGAFLRALKAEFPAEPATIGTDMDPLDRKLDEMQKDDAAMVRSLVRLKERIDRLEHDSVANDADLQRNLVRLKERVDRAEHDDVTHNADLEKALALTDQLTAILERMR